MSTEIITNETDSNNHSNYNYEKIKKSLLNITSKLDLNSEYHNEESNDFGVWHKIDLSRNKGNPVKKTDSKKKSNYYEYDNYFRNFNDSQSHLMHYKNLKNAQLNSNVHPTELSIVRRNNKSKNYYYNNLANQKKENVSRGSDRDNIRSINSTRLSHTSSKAEEYYVSEHNRNILNKNLLNRAESLENRIKKESKLAPEYNLPNLIHKNFPNTNNPNETTSKLEALKRNYKNDLKEISRRLLHSELDSAIAKDKDWLIQNNCKNGKVYTLNERNKTLEYSSIIKNFKEASWLELKYLNKNMKKFDERPKLIRNQKLLIIGKESNIQNSYYKG